MNSEPGGNPLLDVEWGECLLAKGRDRDIEAYARQRVGMVPPYLPYLVHSPWVARSELILNFSQGLLIHLDDDEAELAAMAASLDNACRYCYAASRFLMRLQGISESRLQERESRLRDASGSPRESAMLQFVYRMSRSDPLITADDKQQLLDVGFSSAEIQELAFVVGFMMLANRVGTIPALSPEALEQLPDRWYMRLARPLAWNMVKRHMSRGQTLAKPPPYEGPFAYLVKAFGDSPIAEALAMVLNEAWADTLLTRRCKALLFAVVAKALNCSLSGDESRQLLLAEGLADALIDPILSHLHSPELHATESLLLPFARKTVWYQPSQIQREARELMAHISQAEFVEVVGMVSLANALCRLSAAVVDH